MFDTTLEVLPHIKIETIAVYKPFPIEKLKVSNYITKYLENIKEGKSLIKQYRLEKFEMNIQTIERTFIDKLFAICDYHLAKSYYRYSRHIYDIHMIWNSKLLNIDTVHNIINDIIKDRQRYASRNLSSNPGTNVNDIIKEIINEKVFESDFNNISKQFIYSEVDYIDSIGSLIQILDANILPSDVKKFN